MSSADGIGRPERYPTLSIALHWVTVAVLALAYLSMELKDVLPKSGGARDLVKSLHYTAGLTVFCLTLLRLAVRAGQPPPVITPAPPAWQDRMARWMHRALYGLMLALPLLGWAALSAKGKPITLIGLELPGILPTNKLLAKAFGALHETLASVGYALIGLHALAGLFHHYLMRDDTLKRMWFKGRKPGVSTSTPG